jgi:hypothetical protein
MREALQVQLAALCSEVGAERISGAWAQTADWCFGQLPSLYDKFCQTNESRYGDEITRRVMAVLKELASSKKQCSAANKLATRITARLRLIHEQFGLPRLVLELPIAERVRLAKGERPAKAR